MINELTRRIEQNEEVAMITIIRTEGAAPRGKGSTMLVDSNGNILGGTIGGGAIEEKARQDAVKCLKKGLSEAFYYSLDRDKAGHDSLPMTCGGNVEVFINVFKKKDRLLIVGAGHIGMQLARIAKTVDYWVAVIDNREDFVTKERFPEADELIAGDIAQQLEACDIDEKTNVVIVSHGHEHDEIALEKVIGSAAVYIGMIGSRPKINKCYENLKSRGVSAAELQKVHSPIGLDLGGEKPAEIALAIMAEIQAVKYGKEGGFLYKT